MRWASISAVPIVRPGKRTAEATRGTTGLPRGVVFWVVFWVAEGLLLSGETLGSARVSVAEADFVSTVFFVNEGTTCGDALGAGAATAGAVWRGLRRTSTFDASLLAALGTGVLTAPGRTFCGGLAAAGFLAARFPVAPETGSVLGKTHVPTEGMKRHDFTGTAGPVEAASSGTLAAKRSMVHSVAAPSA